MAGHSHWAGIKHKKAAADKKRGKVFSKHAKAIIIAARDGGGDPEMNLNLKYAIDRAKADNMHKDNIARNIKRGTGELGGATFVNLTYEGFAPQKVAVVMDIQDKVLEVFALLATHARTVCLPQDGKMECPSCVLKKGCPHPKKTTARRKKAK